MKSSYFLAILTKNTTLNVYRLEKKNSDFDMIIYKELEKGNLYNNKKTWKQETFVEKIFNGLFRNYNTLFIL